MFSDQIKKKKKFAANEIFYPVVGFVSCVIFFIYMFLGDLSIHFPKEDLSIHFPKEPEMSFVGRIGNHFILDGKPFYVNGWNSYWLMDQAVDEYSRPRVIEMLQVGAKMGLTVCRTWAFNDGTYNGLQVAPGRFDERVFKALDRVIVEARRQGVRLILCLVNNLQGFGGKPQYVKWAWEKGVGLSSSNDSFFYDPSIRQYFKTYVKTVLTRKNSINGIEYRNDPAIFAWELINEPRCMSDPSGDTLQDWIEEMSGFVKSIDKNHLLTVGLEGFYGPSTPEKLSINPGDWAGALGSDFIRNSKVPTIDFASIHIFPDRWILNQDFEETLNYAKRWAVSHIKDGDKILKKPVLLTEFGFSNRNKNYQPSHRDRFSKAIFDIVHESARKHKSGAGAFIWQFMGRGMEEYSDDFGIFPWETSTMHKIMTGQSCKLAALRQDQVQLKMISKEICSR